MFPDRHTWFDHELQFHRVEWYCQFCTRAPYQSLEIFRIHMQSLHAQKFTEEQLPALVELSQQSLDRIPATACPLCDEWEKILEARNPESSIKALAVTPKQFRHHLGGHMEQLALFALPRSYSGDGDAISIEVAVGAGTRSSDLKKAESSSSAAKTEEMHRAALEMGKALGLEHPDTLDSMNDLGVVLHSQGKDERAEELHRRVLEARE